MVRLTIETVRRERTVSGILVKRHVAVEIEDAPYRLGRRAAYAYQVGLQFMRALGDSAATDMPYVAVVDSQRRILAAWRAMASVPGYTGTTEKHPLISDRGLFYRR